jgi:hypothetical protein
MKHLKKLKKVVHFAQQMGYIDKDPFRVLKQKCVSLLKSEKIPEMVKFGIFVL